MHYFYVLINDSTGRPFYTGHTNDPDRRLREHLDEAAGGGSSLKCQHIRALTADGSTVSMKVVDQTDGDIADIEYYWKDNLEYAGFFLYNGNSGVRGSAINEAQLKRDIAKHKRSIKKRRETLSVVGQPKTAEQIAADEQQYQYWRDNPQAFERERMRRQELTKAEARERRNATR